jgi:hypothetical protein
LKELGPKNLNWIVAQSSHTPEMAPPRSRKKDEKDNLSTAMEL